jgi:hypothetical protein
MFGDRMENHRRSLAEVESPNFIFGGAVGLRRASIKKVGGLMCQRATLKTQMRLRELSPPHKAMVGWFNGVPGSASMRLVADRGYSFPTYRRLLWRQVGVVGSTGAVRHNGE